MTDPQAQFSALADPTRRGVFERLSKEGPASASVLADEFPVTRQAIAKHLAALDEAGLVERSTHGREVRYSARTDSLSAVAEWLGEVDRSWGDRLRRLRESFDG